MPIRYGGVHPFVHRMHNQKMDCTEEDLWCCKCDLGPGMQPQQSYRELSSNVR